MRKITCILPLALLVIVASSALGQTPVPRLIAANAASFDFSAGPTTGIVALFPGSSPGFAADVAVAGSLPLPTELLGVKVLIEGEPAGLFFVSPTQINCLVAERFNGKPVNFDVFRYNVLIYHSAFLVSPGLGVFSANARGFGLAAAVLYESVTRSYRPVVDTDLQPVPIDVGAASPNFLVMYATGQVGAVSATIGGLACEVTYAGASELIGARQINVKLRPELAGRGLCDVRVSVNGREVNAVNVLFK